MIQKPHISKILQNNNLLFTCLVVICNVIAFFIADSNKNTIISLNIFFNCLIFFLYRFRVNALVNKNWLAIKKELMYINYPIIVGLFFLLFAGIFCFDIYCLSKVNRDALNVTFIFTYFMSTISMLLPSILMLSYMHLFYPAILLPAFNEKKRKRKTDILVFILFILFLLFSAFQFSMNIIDNFTSAHKTKYKAAKLAIQYSKEHLKYVDLTPAVRQKLENKKLEVPFMYTTEGFKFKTYEAAEQFCGSMNARVANHLEIYNIIFHRFDTFGEKYYWTSDKAGRTNLVLHFKNMSYEIKKKPQNTDAIVYCTAKANTDNKLFANHYFYKNKPVKIGDEKLTNRERLNLNQKKNYKSDKLKIGTDNQQFKPQKQTFPPAQNDVTRHVNFNVKHVSNEYLNELINKGYYYDTSIKINNYYASSEAKLQSATRTNTYGNEINLCYFPYIDYDNIPIQSEKQIWKQNFCIPSFQIVNKKPELKSLHEKEAYCYANGGRLPNIPELLAIIKTTGNNHIGAKFWTNNKVTNAMYEQKPIAVILTDTQSIKIQEVSTDEAIYTYCIKGSKNPSKIISNFKSKFAGESGQYYAKDICGSCKYYEVPDTVLMQ